MKRRQPPALWILGPFVISVLSFATCPGQVQPRGLLGHLEGSWYMSGNVLKKPVRYVAEGAWVLRNQFLSLHMVDAAVPPTYEVNLLIGIDSVKNQYVAHWLDSFGGAGARVVGLGPLSTEKIEIVFPYAEGRFRNLFRYDAEKDEWTLVIESEGAEGSGLFLQITTSPGNGDLVALAAGMGNKEDQHTETGRP